jgi:hypothetical protein
MRELPENFTVVGDVEFETLSCLPEFERTNDDTLRRQDGDQFFFVCRESEYLRMEAIAAAVDAEIDAMEADVELSPEFGELPKAEIRPKPGKLDQNGLSPDGIPLKDLARKLPDEFPKHPESSRRPAWYRAPFDPFGGRA